MIATGYSVAMFISMVGMCAMDSENLAYPIGIMAVGALIGVITRLAETFMEERDADYTSYLDR